MTAQTKIVVSADWLKNCGRIEIGLFLGYPSEDVKGFIENKAASSKCSGCWKVYGDEQTAMNLFEEYRKCTEICYRKWKNGADVEQLTVSI